jgi:hypothetical protein
MNPSTIFPNDNSLHNRTLKTCANSYIYSQLKRTFDDFGEGHSMRKDFFGEIVLEQLPIHMQKNEAGPLSSLCSKGIKNINVRAKILRRKKKETNLYDLGFSKVFLVMTQK